MIYSVISGFITNEVIIHLHICDHSIFTFFIRVLCLGFSNTSYVDSLGGFIKSVVDKVKIDVCIFEKDNNSKEIIYKYNMQMNLFKLVNG